MCLLYGLCGWAQFVAACGKIGVTVYEQLPVSFPDVIIRSESTNYMVVLAQWHRLCRYQNTMALE